MKNNEANCSFGCLQFLALMITIWAIFGSLPTFWGDLEIDFFGPAIRLDDVTYIGNPK